MRLTRSQCFSEIYGVKTTNNRNEAQHMTEEDAKMIADTVIEWLHDHRYISEEQYGKLPATLGEDIAPVIVEQMNQ